RRKDGKSFRGFLCQVQITTGAAGRSNRRHGPRPVGKCWGDAGSDRADRPRDCLGLDPQESVRRGAEGRAHWRTLMQDHQFATLVPLVVGAGAVACTIFVHALALAATINFVRHERKLGRTGAGALIDLAIVAAARSFAFVAPLIEIALWAALLVACGESQRFGEAYYLSAVNYTTLGYGDLLLSPSWRLLGPLEAANGALMFGVSTAIIFAVIQR